MASRTEVRISGFGGQGIVLAGVILARAAAIHNEMEATQTNSHGAESRGGACVSDVVLSPERIDYPMCLQPDVLVCMSPESATRYVPSMKDGGILVVDEDLVPEIPAGKYSRVLKVPATRVANEDLKKRVVANVVMLGALLGIDPLVTRESMEKAVLDSTPKGTEDLNMAALRRGFELGASAKATS
ncbi:MAG: 2-oxoacid:acceptor oxidoreductase family protein [Bacteroidetes bacterium]|nr:2-oxoacid:acceptor oxidoreductase family protein [Bacteroidota bacterium]